MDVTKCGSKLRFRKTFAGRFTKIVQKKESVELKRRFNPPIIRMGNVLDIVWVVSSDGKVIGRVTFLE